MRLISGCGVSAVVLLSAACSQLPDTGPAYQDVLYSATTVAAPPSPQVLPYALVDVTPIVVDHAEDIGPGSFHRTFGKGKGPAPAVPVGRGDVIQLTVFEKSGGPNPSEPSFRPGNFAQLPPQEVGHDGYIDVPYAGRFLVAGRTLAEVQSEIRSKIEQSAIEPRVIASIVEHNANTVSVVGDVFAPKVVTIPQGGRRILDMIALAGGTRYPGYDT